MPDSASAARFVCVEPAAVYELTGADRLAWLQNFCTADVANLPAGAGCEAFVLNVKGRTLAHVIVLAQQSAVYLLALGSPQTSLAEHLDRYIIREDVQIADRSAQCRLWWLDGPAVGALGLTDNVEEKNSWDHCQARPHVVLIASCITSPRDWLVLVTDRNSESMEITLAPDFSWVTDRAEFERGRIAMRWPLNGIDLTDANFPQEFRRDEQAISFTKGCYLGQETVARIDAIGHVNQFLVKLDIASNPESLVGQDLHAVGIDKPAGRVTSCVPAAASRSKALGFLRQKHIATDAEFQCGDCVARLLDE